MPYYRSKRGGLLYETQNYKNQKKERNRQVRKKQDGECLWMQFDGFIDDILINGRRKKTQAYSE